MSGLIACIVSVRPPIARTCTRWYVLLVAATLCSGAHVHAKSHRLLGPASTDTPDVATARQTVKEAKELARAGDWQRALDKFREAMALHPSPKLHYNIAVCHHRLMLESSEDSAAKASHRAAAIDAYNAYLKENPTASDTHEVERLIAELGGRPVTDRIVERVDDAGGGGAPPLQENEYGTWEDYEREAESEASTVAPTSSPSPTPAPSASRPHGDRKPRARVGGALAISTQHPLDISRGDRVDPAPPLGGGLHAAILLTPRRALAVGGEIFVFGTPSFRRDRHGLASGYLALTTDYAFVIGAARRFEIAVGALVGLAGESLRSRAGAIRASCPTTNKDNAEVSKRGGLIAGARSAFSVLLGRRRSHALSLRATPAVTVMTHGDKDPMCMDTDPFTEFGLPAGAGFAFYVDLGYAFRFP